MATGWGRRYRQKMQQWAVLGTGSADTTMFAGLSTANPADDASANAEPTSAGSYARPGITWATPASGANDATVPALNSASISWTSSAAFSTGATSLTHVSLWNSATLSNVAESFYDGRAAIAVPQAVNASGITLTIAISGLSMGFISA